MTAAEPLRSVTRALSSGSEEEAYGLLPGVLEHGAEGRLDWEAGTLSIPAEGVGVLRVRTGEPDDAMLAAAESVGRQIALFGAERDMAARRRAMLDVAFDSVVTMDDRGALRRVATAVAAEHESARLFTLVSEEVGRLLEAATAHMFRFDPDGAGGTIVGGWALRAEHVLPAGTRMELDGDTAVKRVWRTGRAARMDSYADAEGKLAERMRGYGVQAVVPRRSSSAVRCGARSWSPRWTRSRSRRTPSSVSPTSPSWPRRLWPTRRRARSSPHRAPGSWPPGTPSGGGWSATCTTARSSAWSRWR